MYIINNDVNYLYSQLLCINMLSVFYTRAHRGLCWVLLYQEAVSGQLTSSRCLNTSSLIYAPPQPVVVPDVELHHQMDSVEELNVGAIALMVLHFLLLAYYCYQRNSFGKKETLPTTLQHVKALGPVTLSKTRSGP